MGLEYILRRVAAESGLANLATNTQQKARAIDLVNIACQQIWEYTDLPGCCEEIIINVLANNELALPPFIGELRAMREKNLMHKWTLNDMRPRYQNEPWKQLWRNWRHKGKQAIQIPITNSAPPLEVIAVADNTPVTIRGSTAVANNVEETMIMNRIVQQGLQSFTQIYSISKPSPNLYDIQIQDVNGNLLAILYNNELTTSYIIVDVSQYPFGGETTSGERVMEVLYKKRLYRLTLNSDEFPVSGWDDIIVDKTLQLFNESQAGKEQRALLFAAKAEKAMHNKVRHQEGGIEKEMQFAENPFYALTKRPYSRIWRG